MVVDEIDHAFMRETGFVGEADAHRSVRAIPFAVARERAIPQRTLFVDREIHVHRIERNHGGQQGRVGLGKIADRDQCAAGLAVDRRAHLGELEVELRGRDGRLGRVHRGRSLRGRGDARVEFLARDRLRGGEGLRTLDLGPREACLAARALEFGLGAIEFGLVAALVDHEQQVAFRDFLAFLVRDAFDVAGDARTQFDRLDCGDPAGETVPQADIARNDLGHVDRGRGRRGLAGRGAAAAATEAEHDQRDRGDADQGEDGTPQLRRVAMDLERTCVKRTDLIRRGQVRMTKRGMVGVHGDGNSWLGWEDGEGVEGDSGAISERSSLPASC